MYLRLQNHNLKLSPSKDTIPAGITPNARKEEALTKMHMPEDLKQVRSLLGSLSYYRKFLRDVAKRIRPITSLLQQRV